MRPILARWDELPDKLRIPEVRPYWEIVNARYGQLLVKRALDVTGSLGLAVVLAPAMVAAAIAVKIESPGPVLYRQERVTQYGRCFRIHKFRTMVDGADCLGALVTSNGDSRITRVGSFLRRFRIDEFPQLIDILTGDMSFVGTRPEVPKYVDSYMAEWMATLLLPAGVTSRASIEFKDEAILMSSDGETDSIYLDVILPKKMKLNLDAALNCGLLSDFVVILDTVRSVFLPY